MRRIMILLYLLALFPISSASGSDDISLIIKGIQKRYARYPGFSISYTREVITRTMSLLGNQMRGDIAKGKIFFMPPYSLRLEQNTPQAETIITDKDTLWWYIPKEKRVYKYPAGKFGKELRLLADIFRGLVNVEDKFRVSLLAQGKDGEYQIELIPEPPWKEINRIVISVTREFKIHRVNIQNQLGGITRFELTGLSVREKFDNGFFTFDVPKGVQVIQDVTAQ